MSCDIILWHKIFHLQLFFLSYFNIFTNCLKCYVIRVLVELNAHMSSVVKVLILSWVSNFIVSPKMQIRQDSGYWTVVRFFQIVIKYFELNKILIQIIKMKKFDLVFKSLYRVFITYYIKITVYIIILKLFLTRLFFSIIFIINYYIIKLAILYPNVVFFHTTCPVIKYYYIL